MDAFGTVLLIIFAILIGVVIRGMWNARNVIEYWKNESQAWREQVDDERTRY